MKKEKDPLYNKKIQEALDKLIAEEIIANAFYIGCIVSTSPEKADVFWNMFNDIAIDELDDHYKSLSDYAVDNDYDVVFKYKDLEKNADKRVVKQFNSPKAGQDPKYYVDEAIKSEEYAIESYKKIIDDNELPYEFISILYQNYYDELEHLQKLKILSDAMENNVELNGF